MNELDMLFDLAKKRMVTFKSSVSTQRRTNSESQGIEMYIARDRSQVKDDYRSWQSVASYTDS